eukprot:CAMPEP_0116566576 /NCGR_PEP_ID=MMETSP0397-20121206/14536_1 /TAXON_ID=216820 /ORGANISM="Cyclophora tenuis, Strain ECT3854" /LENGTH=144 /DNA_ID=CAMNT_0004093487 /DNA_START=186 /DNA_END=620 /DNA_ORIENTATION=-
MTLLWIMLVRTLESMGVSREDETSVFGLLICLQIFFPLQGFWNFLIYVRPRYLRWRRREPDMSRFWCLQQALNRHAVLTTSSVAPSEFKSRHRSSEIEDSNATQFTTRFPRPKENDEGESSITCIPEKDQSETEDERSVGKRFG